ncbi:MAG: four helix bundle protein [Saprospiraceae bacterium]|nr:four helix bundle protein [Saprospiraceae bacterium]
MEIYRITRNFPVEERYGLISDMRRSANSVVHNIAEGFGRFEKRDKSRFYKISRGSGYEIISQNLVSEALEFLDSKDCKSLNDSYIDIINELDRIIKAVETR